MNESNIKVELIHQIDSLDDERIIELYGVIQNFIHGGDDEENWDNLSAAQKKGLEYGVNELERGEGIEHQMVMEELKKKYGIV